MATTKTPATKAKKPATTRTKTAAATTEKKVVASAKVTIKAPAEKKTTTAMAQPAAKKVAAKTTEKAVTPKAAAPKKVATKKSLPAISAEERYRMVQDAAYYIAEKNHFTGDARGYWIAAEIEIEEFLADK